MTIKKILVAYGLILIFPYFCLADDITPDNWMYHGDIKEIRKIYSEIKNGVKSGKYKINEYHGNKNCGETGCKTYQYEIKDEYGFVLSCGFTSFLFLIPKEEIKEYYFDKGSTVRFILSIESYFNSNKAERKEIVKSYYNKSGKKIWWVDILDNEVIDSKNEHKIKQPTNVLTNEFCKRLSWGQ